MTIAPAPAALPSTDPRDDAGASDRERLIVFSLAAVGGLVIAVIVTWVVEASIFVGENFRSL